MMIFRLLLLCLTVASFAGCSGGGSVTVEGVPTVQKAHWPVSLSFEVRNSTSKPIDQVSGFYQYRDPSRSTPYCSKSFDVQIPGGVEPGEVVPVEYAKTFRNNRMESDMQRGVDWINEVAQYESDYPNGQWEIVIGDNEPVKMEVTNQHTAEVKRITSGADAILGLKFDDMPKPASELPITERPGFVPAPDYDPSDVERIMNHNPLSK